MKQRLFMDEEPIDDCLATGRCHREASRRGCRAEIQPKHRQETGLRLVGRCFGTCPCPRSGSVEGPRAKGSIDVPFATPECLWSTCGHGSRAKPGPKPDLNPVNGTDFLPFATRGWLWSTCGQGCRAEDLSEDPLRHAGMALRYLWAGELCRRPARSPLRHAITCIRWVPPTCRVRGSIHLSESSAVRCHRSS